MKHKPTPHQKRVLDALIRRGGIASPYELNYPTRPLLDRLERAGFIKPGHGPAWDRWNSNISITDAGRAALAA